MRKIFKHSATFLLMCALALSLTACSTTLNGTYAAKDSFIGQSFTFFSDNTVDVSAFGINVKGEYEIQDSEITITYKLMDLSYDWTKSFARDGNSIFIDGTEFVKES